MDLHGITGSSRLSVRLRFLLLFSTLNLRTAYASQETLHAGNYITAFERGRSLQERDNVSNETRPLVRRERIDPLDGFNKYKGGYDVSNKHYWSSTAFTGKFGYGIGMIWLFGGAIYAIFLLTIRCCLPDHKWRKIKRQPCSRQCYFWPIIWGFLLTILAITLCAVVLGWNSKFNSRVKTVKNILVDTAANASDTIYNVTGAMRAMQDNVGIQGIVIADGMSVRLNSTAQRLDQEAANIDRQARKTRRLINKILTIVYAVTTVVISLTLVTVLALLSSGFLKLRRPFHLLITLCWMLTAFCWIYFGAYFFLDKFVGDTCMAFEEYQQEPNNSSLSSILPCDELLSATPILRDARAGMHDIIDQVNENISTVQASIPALMQVCNPFSAPPDYNYRPQNCSPSTIPIGDIPQMLRPFTCLEGETGLCIISPTDYNAVVIFTTSVQNLLNAFPGMESLIECQVVKDAFEEIISEHCSPLKKYVRIVWISMTVLSTIMVIFVLLWTTIAYHDRNRHFAEGSVKPDSTVVVIDVPPAEFEISGTETKESENKLEP